MTEEDATTQVITSTSVPRGYFSVAFSSLMSIQLPLYDSEGNLGALSFLNKSLSPTQSIVAFNPEDFAEVEALLLDEPSVGISIILSSLELTKYDDPRKKAKDLLKLAELYERQDDLNSSVQALVDAREEVIKADIKTSAISLRIAEVLFHAGNFDRSASESRKYLEVATEYRLEAHVLAARALFELGEFGETIVHARSALDLLSSDPSPATNKLHWIYDLLILSY
ncbi:MAG: hypothetical protein KC777_28535, partial [Cyanobacteria bacterium HKST-UBA02]|nr:hypothetical protein [Cyanobacteria bacterium HKST-UBA02]